MPARALAKESAFVQHAADAVGETTTYKGKRSEEDTRGVIKGCELCISTYFTLDFPCTERAIVKLEATHASWGFRSVGHAFPHVQKSIRNNEADSLPSVLFRPILSCGITSLEENLETDRHLPGLW